MTGKAQRLDSIDLLRGIVILLMALDHTRDFFGDLSVDPMDPAKTWPTLFLTRWISHFCAPVFVFLAGTSAWLQARRKSPAELSYFLISRGLWLVFLELTWVRCFGWFFNFNYQFSVGQVIWAIGWSMVALGVAVRLHLPPQAAGLAGVTVIFLHNLTDGWRAEQFGPLWWVWRLLHDRKIMEIAPGFVFFPQYPLLPWMAILFAGYGFGIFYAMEGERRRRLLLGLGLAAMALFGVVRATQFYGDPRPWAGSVYSFLNVTKYPPSLLFILMTLGPALAVLSRMPDTISGVWRHVVMFGRVPLFFYLIHLPLIHGFAVVYALVVYGRFDWLLDAPGWGKIPPPPGFGLGLASVYAVFGALFWCLCTHFVHGLRAKNAPAAQSGCGICRRVTRIISSLDELQALAGGAVVAISSWIPIEQSLIDSFASLSGDRQWIHVDAERAKGESPWGTTIAHGFLTLSLLSRMAAEAVSLQLGQTASINYGLNKVRFPAPVPVGSRVRGHFAVAGCGARPGGVEVVWRVTVEAEGQEKPVCVAEWVLLLVPTPSV